MSPSLAPIRLAQSLVLQVPLASLRTAALSFDHDGLNGRPGIDLLTRQRGYPRECLRSPYEHLEQLTRQGRIGAGLVLTQTYRNCPQNLRCPLYTREHGVCQTADEQVARSERPYHGIGYLEDGGFHGLALDLRDPVPAAVRWWAGGVPVLWNGSVLRPEQMASEVADFCHLWRLRVSGPHRSEEDVARYQRLTALFRQQLHAPAEVAGGLLWEEASRLGLQREEDYLHNAVGVGAEHLVVVACHGSLERLGELARAAGASHAIVVDNGGSVQVALRRPGPSQPLVALLQATYFREPTIALAAYEMVWDDPSWLPVVAEQRLGRPG